MRWIPLLPLVALLLTLPAPAGAQTDMERFRMYGHLNQAVGVSADVPVHGIPSGDPTTELRTLALQARYIVGDANEVVIQFGHQRLGVNPVEQLQDDVELDWVYYQHRVGDVRVRVGRTPLPYGLFNEMRDVGTVLPFYRVSQNIYPEGFEAVDGVVVSYQVGDALGWNARVEAYGGSTGYRNAYYTASPAMPVFLLDMETDHTFGSQVWVETPIPGVRFGGGFVDFGFKDADAEVSGAEGGYAWIGSVAAELDRLTLHGEYTSLQMEGLDIHTGMLQAGAWLTPAVGVFGQMELVDLDMAMPDPLEFRWSRDYALSLNTRLTPSVVLKVEGHHVSGYSFEQFVDPLGPGLSTVYGITSMSVSF